MADITRKHDYAKKKEITAFAVRLTKDEVDTTDEITVLNLPDNALVLRVNVDIVEATQAGVTMDVNVGDDTVHDGVSVAAKTVLTNADKISTGTGKTVSVESSAKWTQGTVVVSGYYIEYNSGTGYKTDITQTAE